MAVSRVRYGRRMIRHVALFRWTEEATEEQKQRVAAEIARLPSLVPSLRAFHIGSGFVNPMWLHCSLLIWPRLG
jgi:Stress responsive A/B Barrel Domain